MKRFPHKLLAGLIAACALAGAPNPALAQSAADYPAKPILLVIVYAAGGNIGTASVIKAAADGYTLLETTNSHNINASIYKSPGYDARKDFVPVVQLTEAPSVVITHPRSPFRSLPDPAAAARSQPGKFVYGSADYCAVESRDHDGAG